MNAEQIYVIGTPGSNTVKIGRSTHIEKRIADIQRMSPVPLKVMWSHPGGSELETRLHRQFSALRVHGEWFAFGGDPVSRVRWAVQDQPWLRPKVKLKKKRQRQQEQPYRPTAADTPAELAAKSGRTQLAITRLFHLIDQIEDGAERYRAVRDLEGRLASDMKHVQAGIAKELHADRSWRGVGGLLGVTGSRAEQISRAAR